MNPAIGILIGGHSRRMGTPKALIPIDGSTLLERTVATASSITDDILLLGQPPFDLPTSVNLLTIVPDHHPHTGPIGGLESLLISRPNAHCILLACDMPYLSVDLLKRLIEPNDGLDAVVCTTTTEPACHPCCALYKQSSLPAVQAALQARSYGMIDLLSRLRVRRIELTGDEPRWVENWNEPQDVC